MIWFTKLDDGGVFGHVLDVDVGIEHDLIAAAIGLLGQLAHRGATDAVDAVIGAVDFFGGRDDGLDLGLEQAT
jgi:hypothetical protein